MSKKGKNSKSQMRYSISLIAAIASIYFICSVSLACVVSEKNVDEPTNCIEQPVFLYLKADIFDPLQEKPGILTDLKIDSSQGYYIVQFNGPIHEDWRKTIENNGAKILGYIPDHSYLMKMDEGIKKEIEALPFVRWIGLYHPAYKIHPCLLEMVNEIELRILVFKDEDKNLLAVRNRISTLDGNITYYGIDNNIIRVRIDAGKIRDIAFIPEVEWIDFYSPPQPLMNNIRVFTGVNTPHINGFNGSGIVGEVKDGGLELDHPDFVGQIIGTDGSIQDDDHGTCTFGIIFSTGANDADAKGILPGGKGIICYSWGVERTESIVNLVNNWGGLFQSNSWYEGFLDSTYTSISEENDQLVFDYDVLMVYGVANSNYGVYSESCSQDSVAKNVIGVGALWHWDNSDRTDDEWYDLGFGMTPSQGPASDGRVKPDLSGPFDWIYTTDSVDGDGEDGYGPGNYFDDMGGTSGATPVVAGSAGLVYQMYRENHFGNNIAGVLPHAATVKAILIADAYQYDFSQADRFQQGWGLVDVGNVYDIGQDHFIVDESTPLQLSESVNYSIEPTGSGPLKISLVWTDVPGTSSSSKHLINNLNLKVTDPDGVIYLGNYGLITSHWSSSGGSADGKNNVENVFIENPKSGTWTLEVIGQNIPLDGELSTPETDQAFALVASNAVETFRVEITNPSFGDYVNGITTVTGISSGDVTLVEVNIDNMLWEPATGTADWSFTWDTTSYSDGDHIIYARASNGTAYSTIRSIEVIVDNTPPTTQLIIGDPKYFNGTLWTVGPSAEFTLSSDDGNGSDIGAIRYNISYEGLVVQEWIDDDMPTLSWGEGNYTIQYYAEDNLGNTEAINTTSVYVDSTPPETRMDISPPKYRKGSSDSWNVTPESVFTLSSFEYYSGIDTIWHTIDGVYFEGTTFDLSTYSDGPHIITWGSVDNLGNNESGNIDTVNLDSTPPEIGLDIGTPKYRANNNDPWNVTKSTIFTINPQDFYSGINFSWYTVDEFYFEDSNFTLDSFIDGLHFIYYGACDYLGNNLTGNYLTVYLDSRPPTTQVDFGELKYRSHSLHNWNVTSTTIFTLLSDDKHSGVNKTWYVLNGTYFEESSFILENLPDGPYTITLGGIDNLGQNETWNSVTVNLDTHPPSTELNISQPKYREKINDNLNITSETHFMLSSTDDYAGINFVWHIINNEYFEGSTFNIESEKEGYYTIKWGSCDNLLNNESANIQTVYLNVAAPQTKLDIIGKKYRGAEEDDWILTNDTEFILYPSESHQGVNSTWYRINGDYYEGTSFSLIGYEDGLHLIAWGSLDNLGENETGNFMSVILDTTSPMTSIKIGNPKYRADDKDYWAVNGNSFFSLTSSDNLSGVSNTWFWIEDLYYVGTNFTLSGYPDGFYTVKYGSSDNLGNNGTSGTITVYLDDSPPETTIEINTPYHASGGITYINTSAKVNLSANDTGVGVSSIWYSLDGGNYYRTFTKPFTLPQGTTPLIYGADDFLGNRAKANFLSIIVDETDLDRDGIYDVIDLDDDDDGILDENDAYPHDTDNDKEENDVDLDDDGDGIADGKDPFILDTDNDGIPNHEDTDDDQDGIEDIIDPYLLDSDNDGERNDIDLDDDGDGLLDEEEIELGTDQLNPDTDGDGHSDSADLYPLDKSKWEEESNVFAPLLLVFVVVAIVSILLFLLIGRRESRSETEVMYTEDMEEHWEEWPQEALGTEFEGEPTLEGMNIEQEQITPQEEEEIAFEDTFIEEEHEKPLEEEPTLNNMIIKEAQVKPQEDVLAAEAMSSEYESPVPQRERTKLIKRIRCPRCKEAIRITPGEDSSYIECKNCGAKGRLP